MKQPKRFTAVEVRKFTMILLAAAGTAIGTPGTPGMAQAAASTADGVSAAPSPAVPATVKVTVEVRFRNQFLSSAAGTGAVLIGDYGSFVVYRISGASAAAAAAMTGIELRPDFDTVLVRRGPLNTTTGRRIPAGGNAVTTAAAGQAPQRHLGIVQLPGPVNKAGRAALLATGAKIVHYLPQNAFIVWTDGPDQRAAILAQLGDGKPFAFFDDFTAAEALSPQLDLAAGGKGGDVEITVQVYNVAAKQAAPAPDRIAPITALATAVISPPSPVLDGLYTNMTIRVSAAMINVIAAMDAVVNVEPYIEPTLNSERQAQEMAGNLNPAGTAAGGPGYLDWFNAHEFPTTPSSYPILTVTDDGVDNGTIAPVDQVLREAGLTAGTSRLVSNFNATGDAGANSVGGHGHINSTIAAGFDVGLGVLDAGLYIRALGINPYGRIAGTRIFNASGTYNLTNVGNTDAGLIRAEYNQGAMLSTNSWGAAVGGAYNASAQAYDAGTRDASLLNAGSQPLFFIFSAGNSGPSGTTVGSPGTAKNVLTVGASEGSDNDGTDGCATPASSADNIQQIVGFSSRGPCADGRRKPEIVAPGTHVTGRANPAPGYLGNLVCDRYWPAGQTVYARSSGTSHSTPAVAGMATLAWNFLDRVYGITAPSPAMLKAYVIHSARYLVATGGNLPSPAQGYGFADMDSAFSPTTARLIVDQTNIFGGTGESQTTSGSIADPTKPVRITLAWTDPAGTTAGSAWVNDLNLTVDVGGTVYKGNVFTGANSTTGGVSDTANNYECVFLPIGTVGPMTVTVTAANLPGNGVPGNPDATDQDYALVMSNMTQAGVALSIQGAVVVNDSIPSGNNNGRAEPGEANLTVTATIRNAGTENSGPIAITLTPVGSTAATPPIPATISNITSNGTATLTLSGLAIGAAQPCGSIAQFTLTAIAGTNPPVDLAVNIPVGSLGGLSTQTFAYNGTPAGITSDVPRTRPITVIGYEPAATVTDVNFVIGGATCSGAIGAPGVGIAHPNVGDLQVDLISPSGTSVNIMNQPGGGARGSSGNNFCQATFDDQGGFASVQNINPLAAGPFTGNFSPNAPLSAFNGQSPAGDWLVRYFDRYSAADIGTFRAASVVLTVRSSPVCAAPLQPPAVCLADRTGDGTVDGSDFVVFINSFSANDPAVDARADVAGTGPNGLSPDGIIDGNDFIAFINAFTVGC